MGLSATPNTAATDLGAMLSAANAAADKPQTASSGADTFGNLLSDRLNQEAARRQADAQAASNSNNSSAATRRTDTAKKDAANANAARNDQDTRQADQDARTAPASTASSTQGAQAAKPAQGDDTKDKSDAAQAAADPAAQLAAQIEAARQAAQQAAAQASQSATQAAAASDAAAQQLATGKAGSADAAALAALNAANTAAGKATDPATAVAQSQAAQTEALKSAGKEVQAAATQSTPLPDANAFAQTLARTRAATDNTPPSVRRLGSTSSTQGTGSEHSAAARRAEAEHSTQTQTTTAATEASRSADTGSHTGTQADAQGAKLDGVLTRANGEAVAAAPTFAAGGAGTAGSTAGTAAVVPAQTHTLPTLGDAAWPHTMASQLAYMQVHRQSSAELQLSPAELGGLKVKLEVDNGAVNASFVCQHQAVAELVQDAMPRLRDAMQQGGMQLAQTSVSTGDFSQQNASQGSSAQGNGSGSGSGGSGGNRFAGAQGLADTGTVAVSTPRVSSHAGAIDTFA
ncbi:flagellar hook-length control protein FliK [Ralstonia solanacearum]|uniref:flagellar hook-length control protein FliK n=1 Tax=Ralstonia solanacearum TaxID=305 RepID=UPI000BE775B9|nr:flagellar hook-length control protein FliK [Ralstonia solanacearum]ATJ88047.1 flagellar hook-length control protein [Ralstonia solanacearum]